MGESQCMLGSITEDGIPAMPFAHDSVVNKSETSDTLLAMALDAAKQNARQQASSMGIPWDRLEQALSQITSEALPEKIARVFYTCMP